MKRVNFILGLLIVMSLVLSACADNQGEEGTPGALATQPAETAMVTPEETQAPSMTEEPTATTEPTPTEMPTATEAPTATSAVQATEPVTGTAQVVAGSQVNPTRVSNLLDYEVKNSDGEVIGDVNNMVVDLSTSRISYVIVGAGGFLGLGEKDILAPFSAFQIKPQGTNVENTDQQGFYLDVSQEALTNAPEVDVNAVVDNPNPAWDADVSTYWQGQGVSIQTNETMTQTKMTGIALAEDLLGYNVAGPDGEEDGEVQDMVIDDQNGNVKYVLISAGSGLGLEGDYLIPVPMKALNLTDNRDGFTLAVSQEDLLNAPNFTPDNFPNTAESGWDADVEAYWNGISID